MWLCRMKQERSVSIVQEIMFKSTDYLRRIIAPVEDYVWWVSGRSTTKWWCVNCGERYDWRQPNRLMVVETGESFEQAQVFKAHAVPRGLCANLKNTLELLANQQEDGDRLLQSVVTNLGKGSRKGLTDGLREFIKGGQ